MHATARKVEPEETLHSVQSFDGLSLVELSMLLGERPHMLAVFAAAGVIKRDRDGRFAIVESVERYWRYWAEVVGAVERGRAWMRPQHATTTDLAERVEALESDVALLMALVSVATGRLEGEAAPVDNEFAMTIKGAVLDAIFRVIGRKLDQVRQDQRV
jgi:hypothetical protein